MRQVLDYNVQELFDPVQTHAAYKVHERDVPALKTHLKAKHNATRFRIVKSQVQGLVIVCFKLKAK
jgi:hypothetical protein